MLSMTIRVVENKKLDAGSMSAQADAVIGSKLTEMGLVVQRNVQQRTPLGAMKLLRGSIFSEPRGTPVREVLVSTPSPYGLIVEEGRNPGRPPPDGPIRLWVMRKLGIGGGAEVQFNRRSFLALSGRKRLKKGEAQAARDMAQERLDRVTFLIRMKIAFRGTKGAHMFQRGYEASLVTLRRLANEMGAEIIAEWKK